MAKHDIFASMTLRVLGHRERKDWAAHCLETDLVGHGRTFEAALENLMELTEMQVSFARFKNQPALLDHPAPPGIWEMYTRLAQEHLRNFQEPTHTSTTALGALPFPTNAGPKGNLAWRGA